MTETRFPAPLYAAAGAGDLAYQQLRKLPAKVSELSDRAAASLKTANETATTTAAGLKEKAGTTDFDRIRETATTTAVTLAQAAGERALAVYTALVAHGERVVGTGVVEAADVVNADIEATDEPTAVTAAPTASASAEPKAVEATPEVLATTPKPRKRAKPAAN